MEVKTETIKGESIHFGVDSDGMFHAEYNDTRFSGSTLEKVREQVIKEIGRAQGTKPIDVTIVGWHLDSYNSKKDRMAVVDVQLRGVNAHTRGLMLTATGKKITADGYGVKENVLRRLTKAEASQYLALATELVAAEKAYQKFIDDRRVDLTPYQGK